MIHVCNPEQLLVFRALRLGRRVHKSTSWTPPTHGRSLNAIENNSFVFRALRVGWRVHQSTSRTPGTIARRYQFFGSGSGLGSCFRVKNLPWFLHRFLFGSQEPSSVRFSVFMKSQEYSLFFLGIHAFGWYLSILLDFLFFPIGFSKNLVDLSQGLISESGPVLGSVLSSS